MIPFVKAHACGNDFLIVDDSLADGEHGELAQRLCARNSGVGADGVEYVVAGKGEDTEIRLFNADGSEAEISGNGTRCVAAWFAYSLGKKEMNVLTKAGSRRCREIGRSGSTLHIETEMGVPIVKEYSVRLTEQLVLHGAVVSVGNPHYVVFVESEDFLVQGIPWRQMGEMIVNHSDFPDGTNAEFVRILDRETIAFRIYERGVGPTLSSGTGSCASAAASMVLRGTEPTLAVIAEGGEQTVCWPDTSESMLLTGPATIVARGEAYLL